MKRLQEWWEKIRPARKKAQSEMPEINGRPITRAEYRLSGKGRYELDQTTGKLTIEGKTDRLKHRLNVIIAWLVVLIIMVYVLLFML